MKEINWNGIILYEYENEKIYKNERSIRKHYKISLIFGIIQAIVYTINLITVTLILDKQSFYEIWFYIWFYMSCLYVPLSLFCGANASFYGKKPSEIPWDEKKFIIKKKSTKKKMTHFPLASIVLADLLPILYELVGCFVTGVLLDNIAISFNLLGYLLLTYIWIYIAVAKEIENGFLMEKEWEVTPPSLIVEAQKELAEQKMKKEYDTLIQVCGVKFFVKYYKQIRLLPLRDVTIAENYSLEEKQERLLAAKKIIDTNLTEFTLQEILNTYRDILDDEEIEQTKSLLEEIQELKRTTCKFILKNGTSPKTIMAPLFINMGDCCILVFDDKKCVGIVWEHFENRKSEANGQAEIRFFDGLREMYGVWHRIFVNEERISYKFLKSELEKKDEYVYIAKIRGH